MEAHLVHKSGDGQLAVVAVFMKTGKENSFIKTLWSSLPSEEGEEHYVKNISINANDLMPSDRVYYRFAGSLTTPPCSEDVIWNVLKNPVEVSEDQINRFVSIFKMNARPVQPRNDRTIRITD